MCTNTQYVKLSSPVGPVMVPVVERLTERILEQVEGRPGSLHLGAWHGRTDPDGTISDVEPECATVHCIAGWAMMIAGRDWIKPNVVGDTNEEGLDTGQCAALLFEAAGEVVPDFYCEAQPWDPDYRDPRDADQDDDAFGWLHRNRRARQQLVNLSAIYRARREAIERTFNVDCTFDSNTGELLSAKVAA